MIRHKVIFATQAQHWLASAEAPVRGAIGHALYKLQCDPSDGDVSLLRDVKHDGKPVRRLRVGSYRVGFQLVGNVLVVISVLWIDKRGDSY